MDRIFFFFFCDATTKIRIRPPRSHCYITHNFKHAHPVERLWTSYYPVIETAINTTQKTKDQNCDSSRIQTRYAKKSSGLRVILRKISKFCCDSKQFCGQCLSQLVKIFVVEFFFKRKSLFSYYFSFLFSCFKCWLIKTQLYYHSCIQIMD